jgi:hypothetical protein
VTSHASGTFEVKLTPQRDEGGADAGLGRMSIDKQFHGDLEGTSKGFMLSSAATVVKGSGGYVAMERVTGTLKGRAGSFVLQHSGTMTRGAPQLSVTVVPDSGTGQLEGITGTLTIKIADGSTRTNSSTCCRKALLAPSQSEFNESPLEKQNARDS